MPHLRISVLAVTLLAALAGCQKGPIAAEPDHVSQYPKVTLSSETLADRVVLNPATVSETATGNLAVSQPIRSVVDAGLDIQYKFEWLDKLGQRIEPDMNWRYKRLEPFVPDFISAASSSAEAVDYRVILRWSRP